jgi:hypothetical protein
LRTLAIVVPIIVAIIGAVAHLSGAFIQRTDQKPKFSEPTKIEQHTRGSGSPAIGQTGGNVTIICQRVDPQAMDALNRELGLTKGQLSLTKQQLEQKTKEANEKAREYHDLSRQFKALQDKKLIQEGKALLNA